MVNVPTGADADTSDGLSIPGFPVGAGVGGLGISVVKTYGEVWVGEAAAARQAF